MSDGSSLLEGWKQIAAAAGRSEDAVQRVSKRVFDPLPVWYDAWETPISTAAAVTAWLKRNTLPAHAYHALKEHGLHPSQRGPAGEANGAPATRPVRRRATRAVQNG